MDSDGVDVFPLLRQSRPVSKVNVSIFQLFALHRSPPSLSSTIDASLKLKKSAEFKTKTDFVTCVQPNI